MKNELVNSKAFTADDLETGGYKIVTTLDKDMQDEIQQVGDTRPEGMPESIQVGGIAVDQKTGSVKAMYAATITSPSSSTTPRRPRSNRVPP